MTQISLTREQLINLGNAGVEKVKEQLAAGKFGTYRRNLVEKWVADEPKREKEAKRLAKIAADEQKAKEKAEKAEKAKEAEENEEI